MTTLQESLTLKRSDARKHTKCKNPSPEAVESSSSGQKDESQWLTTLSEPELDLLISLKTLVKTRAKTSGYPDLDKLFDPRMLRALGVVLLESLKERLKETFINPTFVDRLALLCDPGADFTNSGSESSDSEVVKPSKDQSTPNSVNKKRAQMLDGYAELFSEGDSSESDNEIEVPEDSDEKTKSPEVKEESPSEDAKPTACSAHSFSSQKEPLVQATLSSMFKKAEERKRSTRSPKGSPVTKGPAAKKQRASTKEKQPAGKNSSGSRRKQKTKDNIVDDESDEDWAE